MTRDMVEWGEGGKPIDGEREGEFVNGGGRARERERDLSEWINHKWF